MGELLEVQGLKTHLFTKRGVVKAVDGVSFSVKRGETLGLVGESGSGKTMTCLSLLKLQPQPAGRIVAGKVLFDGEDLVTKNEAAMRRIRGRQICMILQDPLTSLNPAYSVGDQVAEAIALHLRIKRKPLRDRVIEALRLVKIPAPETRIHHYPHQMSGGMRQRITGAIAFSTHPALLIADEPTTSLDPTIQAQYLELLKEIQVESQLSMIFITHDLGIVVRMCDKVAVMYAGTIVELASTRELFKSPHHPYTEALIRSVPRLETREHKLISIPGHPPDLVDRPVGCAFAPRCPRALDICTKAAPSQVAVRSGHYVSCWLQG